MAKVQNTLIGRASGSVGGATFTTWKGVNVLKSKPESVANPRTLGQRSQRNRLSIMVAVYRLLASIVLVGFKARAIGISEYNAFMSANIVPATTVDANGNASIDFVNVKFALGTMGVTPIESVTANAGQQICQVEFSDENIPLSGGLDDEGYLVAHNSRLDEWAIGNIVARDEGETSVTFSENIEAGDTINCYLFFKSANSDTVSDSVHESVEA